MRPTNSGTISGSTIAVSCPRILAAVFFAVTSASLYSASSCALSPALCTSSAVSSYITATCRVDSRELVCDAATSDSFVVRPRKRIKSSDTPSVFCNVSAESVLPLASCRRFNSFTLNSRRVSAASSSATWLLPTRTDLTLVPTLTICFSVFAKSSCNFHRFPAEFVSCTALPVLRPSRVLAA